METQRGAAGGDSRPTADREFHDSATRRRKDIIFTHTGPMHMFIYIGFTHSCPELGMTRTPLGRRVNEQTGASTQRRTGNEEEKTTGAATWAVSRWAARKRPDPEGCVLRLCVCATFWEKQDDRGRRS